MQDRQHKMPPPKVVRGEVQPRLRSGFLIRERLTLPAELSGCLVGVLAPTGFGKTQQLAYWYYDFAVDGFDTAWLNGHELTDLVSGVASLKLPFTSGRKARALFIDNVSQHEDIHWLLARLDSSTTVFVGGNECLRHHLSFDIVFTQENLRLTPAEAAAFLQHRLAGDRPTAEILRQCEGVPALVNIAATDLLHAMPATCFPQLHPDGLAVAYMESLLRDLSREQRQFLTDIAIVDVISHDLATLLTGRDDAPEALERLAVCTPLFRKSGARSFTLLPLARAFLDGQACGTDRRRSRNCLAASWFEQRGAYGEAIHHALSGSDSDLALGLMDAHLLEFVASGDLERALEWISHVPKSKLVARPDLCLAAAFAYLIADDLAQARWVLGHLSPDNCLIVRALYASRKDGYDEVETLLADVAQPDELTPLAYACFDNLRRCADQRRGIWIASSQRHPERAKKAPPKPRLTHAVDLFLESERLLVAAQSASAIAVIKPLVDECEEHLGPSACLAALASSMLAAAYFQAGEAGRAQDLLAVRLETMIRHSTPGVACLGLLTASRIAALQSDYGACLDHLDRLEAIGLEREVNRLRALALAERVRIYALGRQQMLASFTLATLEAVNRQVLAHTPINAARINLETLLARAHVLRSLNKQSDLAPVLDEAEKAATATGRIIELAEAIALRHDDVDRARHELRCRLPGLAEADGRSLLARLGIGPLPLQSLHATAADAEALVQIVDKPVIVKLTLREQHILKGLSGDLSNKAIARELDLSGETVKWYVSRLFDKLDARDRRHAVIRAQALGLLHLSYARPARSAKR